MTGFCDSRAQGGSILWRSDFLEVCWGGFLMVEKKVVEKILGKKRVGVRLGHGREREEVSNVVGRGPGLRC